jgi:iron complex outermembrane receptor protein
MVLGHSRRRALLLACSPLVLSVVFAAAPGAARAQSAPSTDSATSSVASPNTNLDLGAVLSQGAGDAADLPTTPGTAPYEAPSLTPLNAIQPTSVVNEHTIDEQLTGTESYADAIRLTPSVNNIDPNGPGLQEADGPTIRGFQDGQYNLTFDGIPIGDSNDFTHHSTSFFANGDIGETIVDRGPGTAETLGDATFGGTVSVRTINPAASTTLTPYGEYGSYNTSLEGVRVDTGAIQSANGTQAVFNFEHSQSSGALSYAGQERSNFFGKIIVPVSTNTTVTFLADYNRVYQNPSIGATPDEMQYYGNTFAYTDDPNSQNYNRYNTDHITTDMEYVDVASHFANGLQYDGKLYTYAYYHEDLNGDDVNDQGLPGQLSNGDILTNGGVPNEVVLTPGGNPQPGVPGQVFKNSYRSVGTIQRVEKDFDFGDIKAGVWIDHQVNTRFVQNVDLTDGNAINYDPADSNGGKVTALNDLDSIERLQHNQLYTYQPYIQGDWKPIAGLTLTAGVKEAIFRRALDAAVQQKTELPTGYEHTYSQALPSFEAKYSVTPNLSTYVQAAEGFLAPNLNTFYTNNIAKDAYAPEQTWSYQTGLAYQDRHVALGADVYLVHFTNFINHTGSGSNEVFFNGGGAIYKGVEGEAAYTFDSGFTFFANAGLNKSNSTGTNAYIAQAPQFTSNAGIIYDKNGVYASLIDQTTGGEYGGAPADATTNTRVPGEWYDPYNIVNAAVGYTFNNAYPHLKQIDVKLNLDNLTNQTQTIFDNGTNAMGQSLYFVLPGASAFITVSVPLSF